MKSIKNKIALVTGSASGMGKESALEMARKGAHIVLVDINEQGMHSVADQIKAMGRRATCIKANLASKDEIKRVAMEALEHESHIDILYNNAGVALVEELKDTKEQDWEWLVDINFWAPIRLTNELLPHMIERGQGHIVTTASVAGLIGASMLGAYSVTKFGMVGYSEALRAEVSQYGIKVSAVCPGVVRTDLVNTIKVPGVKGGLGHYIDRFFGMVGMDQKEAGRQIVRGIRQNKGYVLIAREAKPLWYLKRMSPEAAYYVNKAIFRLMRSERDSLRRQRPADIELGELPGGKVTRIRN